MIPGVMWSRLNRRWRAVLSGYGSNGYIGEYRTVEEAIAARQAAELAVDGRLHDQAQAEMDGDIGRVPLWARRGRLVGWAIVDAADLALVAGSRWASRGPGYAVARIDGRAIDMHHVILPGDFVRDHINGDVRDNRRANLRACSAAENARNTAPTKGRGLYKGVSVTAEGTYRARLMLNRREIWLGRYDTPEEAARAYDRGAVEHFGAFARLNFPVEALQPQENGQ